MKTLTVILLLAAFSVGANAMSMPDGFQTGKMCTHAEDKNCMKMLTPEKAVPKDGDEKKAKKD
jgi:hypothetical protein